MSLTETQVRQNFVKLAQKYVGCKESDGSHKKIIDLYNSHKPLAVGYKVKYTDAWCSTYASAIAIEAGYTDIIPTECGCERHINLFKKLGIWVEDDAYVPEPGDYIFYDWDDKADTYATTDLKNPADHVGIVVSCDGKMSLVVEGNISNAVGYRKVPVNGRYVRGYGTPKFELKANMMESAQKPAEKEPVGTITPGLKEVTHTVKKGETLGKIAQRYGITYQEIAKLNGIPNPNLIKVGQVLKIPSKDQPKTYTVQAGDSLWSIAQKVYGNGSKYTTIKAKNSLRSDTIYKGQVLVI